MMSIDSQLESDVDLYSHLNEYVIQQDISWILVSLNGLGKQLVVTFW